MPPNFTTLYRRPDKEENIKQNESEEFVENKKELTKKRWYEFETEVVWSNVIIITFLHVMALYYLFAYPYWKYKILTVWGKY